MASCCIQTDFNLQRPAFLKNLIYIKEQIKVIHGLICFI